MRTTKKFAPHPPATVDDLTDMLDFGSEDIDGMDDDAGTIAHRALDSHFIT